MNKLIFLLTMVVSTSLFASELPSFSSFASGDKLYVTMMTDTCNSHSAGLKLAPNCAAAELGQMSTTDYVTTCKAQIQIRSTKMACRDSASKATAFEINLKNYNLRKTINTLELSTYRDSIVTVNLNEEPKLGAFLHNDELQLTVFGDKCNSVGASLDVNKFCDKDRVTRNGVVTCDAKLLVFQTEIFCGDPALVPRVTSISLKGTQVDPMARKLVLDYYTKVEVDLK